MRILMLIVFLLASSSLAQTGSSIGNTGTLVQCYAVSSENVQGDQTRPTLRQSNKCVVVYKSKYYQLVLGVGILLIAVGLAVMSLQVYSHTKDRTELRRQLGQVSIDLQELTSGRASNRGWEVGNLSGLLEKITESIGKFASALATLPGSSGLFLAVLGGFLIWLALNAEIRIVAL